MIFNFNNLQSNIPFTMKHLLLLIFIHLSLSGYSQYLRTPSELQKLAEKSTINYLIDTAAYEIVPTNYPVLKDTYIKNENDSLHIIVYKTNPKAEKYRKKAFKAAKAEKFHKAATFLEKALKKAPTNANLVKDLGKLVGETGEYRDAIKLYKQVIDRNQYDFDAHLAIAKIYEESGDHTKALDHTLLAHLYNRNDTVILDSLKSVFKRNDIRYPVVNFEPNYTLTYSNDSIQIQSVDSTWIVYGLCKAIWEFETDYVVNKKDLSDQPIDMIEEKECLLCALITYDETTKEHQKIPEMRKLSDALLSNKIDQFILYEHMLKEDPTLAYQLEPTMIDKLKSYLTDQKPKK